MEHMGRLPVFWALLGNLEHWDPKKNNNFDNPTFTFLTGRPLRTPQRDSRLRAFDSGGCEVKGQPGPVEECRI